MHSDEELFDIKRWTLRLIFWKRSLGTRFSTRPSLGEEEVGGSDLGKVGGSDLGEVGGFDLGEVGGLSSCSS